MILMSKCKKNYIIAKITILKFNKNKESIKNYFPYFYNKLIYYYSDKIKSLLANNNFLIFSICFLERCE